MMDPFDSVLRERITRLMAAVPAGSTAQPNLSRPTARHLMVRKRLLFAVGLALPILTSLAVGLPTLSRPTYEGALRDIGVPEGVEIMASSGDARGNLFDVLYRDKDGKVHCAKGKGDCHVSIIDPSGKVLYDGGHGPEATPRPRP
jgi:hypothetical protein